MAIFSYLIIIEHTSIYIIIVNLYNNLCVSL